MAVSSLRWFDVHRICPCHGSGDVPGTYTLPHSPTTPHLDSGCPPCLHPISQPSKSSIALTGPYRGFTTNSATHSMGRSIFNARKIFKKGMLNGLLIIWTMYVTVSSTLALRPSQRRLLIASIPSVLLSESAYVNSRAYADPGRYSLHRIRFRLP